MLEIILKDPFKLLNRPYCGKDVSYLRSGRMKKVFILTAEGNMLVMNTKEERAWKWKGVL